MPWSVDSLAGDLRALGLGAGDVVLVHGSLRRIGEVAGGAASVIEALRRTVGDEGTVVMPTFTEENSKTSRAHRRRIEGLSEPEVARFRAAMPAFDAATTPSGTGHLSEVLRRTPGAVRSGHPVTSFAALGPLAGRLLADHAPDCHHGERSPLGRLYPAGARVLLAGVGYEACSAFHLAEYRLPDPPRTTYEFVADDGRGPRWHAVESVRLDDGDFGALGAALEARTGLVVRGTLGSADARVLPLAPAVDFAVRWLTTHRRAR